MGQWLTIIGIGEDGLDGLGLAARQALGNAQVIFGGKRHLDLIGPRDAICIAWPVPFSGAFEQILHHRGQNTVVLASGDPMHYGMGASLSRKILADEMLVIPFPSSFSLAAARLGWPLQDCELISVHGRPLEVLQAHIQPGNRLLVLSNDGETASLAAQMLVARGFGGSVITVLEHLGGPREQRISRIASEWKAEKNADLNILCIECVAGTSAQILPLVAGLPDEAFENDGQLTKRDVRAVTLARLGPLPRQLLWDVGAGCGSIGIEWMRAHPTCRTLAIEADAGRQAMIERNRAALGVPGLQLIKGEAPAALSGLEAPDAIFIGGGVTDEGVLNACWSALRPGGRLVANAVTLQSEMLLFQWRQHHGGELVRLAVAQAGALGSFDVWRQALPVTMLCVEKPH